MAQREYLTTPLPTTKMPGGIPYILTNEAAERFAFYGLTGVLVMFMTTHLRDPMSDVQAQEYFHWFKFAVYFTPLLGALISDIWLGKFRTIFFFSLVYCVGFFWLLFDMTRSGLAVGLILIAIGSGIIKPCVSANVGDQFGQTNKHLLNKVYHWFYFAINLGAAISMFLCPWLRANYGPRAAFAVVAALMALATFAFWIGKWRYVHVPRGGAAFVKESFSGEGLRAILKLSIIYLFIAVFWSLFDQSQSAWVNQAKDMNLRWLGITWLPDQIQAFNSVLILIMIPLFASVIYPAINRFFALTDLRKIGIGLFVGVLSFVVPALIEGRIAAGAKPSIGWQFVAYIFLTAGEVMVSITGLEFSYTQAPMKMKSFIMSIFLLSIALGNAFTAGVNAVIERPDGSNLLVGANYYWFFGGAMLVSAILFIPVARCYPVKDYIQDEASAESQDA